MAEDAPKKAPKGDAKSEIAAAEWLFQDDPGAKSKKPGAESAVSGDADDVFALADPSGFEIPTALGPAAPARGSAPAPAVDADSKLDPSSLVEELWSRAGEWGGSLIVVGGWLAVLAIVVYVCLQQELYGFAFLVLLVGGLIAVVLAYPILITLERPVRVTPEQAVRDYYGALSHHWPHFRRMWLLLSKAGRVSTAYGSYEGFKAYWSDRLGRLRRGHAGTLTPLVFEIEDFKAEKSAGKVKIDADFSLKVSVRGQRSAGPIHRIPMQIALVRGPDKMWYLESGTLPASAAL
jgi:hypothetical protein